MHLAVSAVVLAEVVRGDHLHYMSVNFRFSTATTSSRQNTCYSFLAASLLEVNWLVRVLGHWEKCWVV